ncbi:hypothetical protein GCM10027162_60130 [Streptomyces incanus]
MLFAASLTDPAYRATEAPEAADGVAAVWALAGTAAPSALEARPRPRARARNLADVRDNFIWGGSYSLGDASTRCAVDSA